MSESPWRTTKRENSISVDHVEHGIDFTCFFLPFIEPTSKLLKMRLLLVCVGCPPFDQINSDETTVSDLLVADKLRQMGRSLVIPDAAIEALIQKYEE